MTAESCSIGRFDVTYRLPAEQQDARRRLDALLERVLEAAVDEALARTGVGPDEEICIRTVAADARVRLAGTDHGLVSEWGSALARALAAAIEAGEPASVRYASRRQALVDVALGTAAGDLRRAWAWGQLGLWPDDRDVDGAEAVSRLADALCAEPRSIVPVLVAASRRGAFPRLAVLLSTADWLRLAQAALAASGAPSGLLDSPSEEASGLVGVAEEVRHQTAAEQALHLLSTSALATAAIASGAALGLSPGARRALAVLAVLETDPAALAAAEPDAAGPLVDALAHELGSTGEATGKRPAENTDGPRRAAARDRRRRTRTTEGEAATPEQEPVAGPADDAPARVRKRAFTDYGGLLFLLPLAADLEPLGGRTIRWSLHRLALVLLPELDEADPAALAFAGLGPDEAPPSDEDDPVTEAELAQLETSAAGMTVRLAELLDDRPGRELVEGVCTRRAEIVADPGWIEVRFDLESLDISLRRAGLDLDPDWLPWLGVVVRFTYV